MARLNEIYKCEACGHIVQILHEGEGSLVCCEQPMVKLNEQTADATNEKHVPVITKTPFGYEVKVGSIPHPMEEKHHIEWIELIADNKSYRQYLQPGDEPVAIFCVEATTVSAREHCNIHGLWRG